MIYNEKHLKKANESSKKKGIRLALNQLAWLLVHRKEEVVNAFNDAGYQVDVDADPRKLKDILRKAVINVKDGSREPRDRKLVYNVSALVVAHRQDKLSHKKMVKSLFKSKKEFSNLTDEERAEYEDARAGYESSQNKGGWLKDNADTIGDVAGRLITGLFGNKGNDQVNDQIGTYENRPAPTKSKTGLIIGIGVLSLAVLGTVVYFAKRKK